ncbi:MAG: SusC/RagA family TonB-linked outer membrane protein, partial [Bacteroidales bacterium]|nr:SusC/RagA family TonB-linked outer membrane protein [Bacteroidales bacterium]
SASVYSQTTKLSLDMRNAKVAEVLDAIESQSEFRFAYSPGFIDLDRKVTVKLRDKTIDESLKEVFAGADVEFSVYDRHILLYPQSMKPGEEPLVSHATGVQQRGVSGKVTDSGGQPLPGVTVVVKGTTQGTITDLDGNYTITNIPDGATLIFSFVGMKTQEIAVRTQARIDVRMEEETLGLGEVVVTALGIKRETKVLGFAVTRVDEEEFSKIREENFMNSLVGKVAGLDIGGNISNPAGSTRVTIRGNTSISGDNQPLYVINGIPMDNSKFGESGEAGKIPNWGDNVSSLNSEDIEEITVLKGATAAALYGSRAKNGAILITTKSGSGREGFGVEFTTHNTWEKPYFIWDEILQREYGQGIGGFRPATIDNAAKYNQRHWGEKLDGKMTIQWDGVERPYSYKKDELLDDLYSTGFTTSNTIAFTSGGSDGSFRLGFSEMRSDGIIQNFNMKRRNISLNTNRKILKNLEFSVSADYINEGVKNRYFRNTQGGLPQVALMITNNMGPNELKPGYDENFRETGVGTDGNATNPYFTLDRFSNHSDKDRFLTALTAKWDILSWLFVRGKVGQDFYTFGYENIIPDGTAFALNGYIEQQDRKFIERNYEILVGLDKNISDDISFNLNVGGNLMSQKSIATNIRGDGFQVPQFHVVNNTKERVTTLGGYQRKTNSIFGTAEFGFRDYLFINVTGRNDWFSTLNPKSNNYFYPSIGGSFIFSELFDLPDFINFGKLRTSYASVGGDTSPYQLHLTYGFVGSLYDGAPLGTIKQSVVPNAMIRPLRVDEFEVGGELKLFDNRLGLDLAFYNKLTSDDITQESISSTTGYSGNWVNVGQIRNKGLEVLIYGTPVKTNNFSWDLSFNGAYNKSKVLKISETTDELVAYRSGAYFKQIAGMEYSQIAGFTILKNEKGEEIIDATGLPKLSTEVVNFGSGVHKYMSGLSNNFRYKNILLAVSIDGKFGAKIYSNTHNQLGHRGLLKSTLPGRENGIILPGVTEDGQPNTVMITKERVSNRDIIQRRRDAVDDYLFDASFIKLRNVSLTYILSQDIVKSMKLIQEASITLVGRNLATLLRNTPGFDPETNALSG